MREPMRSASSIHSRIACWTFCAASAAVSPSDMHPGIGHPCNIPAPILFGERPYLNVIAGKIDQYLHSWPLTAWWIARGAVAARANSGRPLRRVNWQDAKLKPLTAPRKVRSSI